jgi:hypothetical protein
LKNVFYKSVLEFLFTPVYVPGNPNNFLKNIIIAVPYSIVLFLSVLELSLLCGEGRGGSQLLGGGGQVMGMLRCLPLERICKDARKVSAESTSPEPESYFLGEESIRLLLQ